MSCDACEAPVIEDSGTCLFCHSPVTHGWDEPESLIEYLATRLPYATTKRKLLDRKTLSEVTLVVNDKLFRAYLHKTGIRFEPDVDAVEWLEQLLAALRNEARVDHLVRRTVTRAGWSLH